MVNICVLKCNTYRLNQKTQTYYQNFFNQKIPVKNIFDCVHDRFPTIKEIKKFDFFILTGTKCIQVLCRNKPVFIDNLLKCIKYIVDNDKVLYGTCFGHQIVSHFFGAIIKRRCPKNYWEIGFLKLPITNAAINMSPFNKNNTKDLTMITAHHDYVADISGTVLCRILVGSNSFLVTFNKKGQIQTLTCQGHFLFDESYFTKHHKEFFTSRFPEHYVRNLRENQINNPIVKKEYLKSKSQIKTFCNTYLIKRKVLDKKIVDSFENSYKGPEIIKNCKKNDSDNDSYSSDTDNSDISDSD